MGESGQCAYRFGSGYSETATLPDGKRVQLRPILPTDKELLLRSFDLMSPDSRYTRFMTHKTSLSDRELRYLTEVDGVDHFAILAVRSRLMRSDLAVGVGRFVRLSDHPDTAEPALAILDSFQGKGLGSLLLARLIDAAWERDVRWFRMELLAQNIGMKRITESLSPDVAFRPAGDGCLEATFPIHEPDATSTPGRLKPTSLFRVLAQAAGADITVRPTSATSPPDEPPDED